jgi:hypothetical protein
MMMPGVTLNQEGGVVALSQKMQIVRFDGKAWIKEGEPVEGLKQ